MIAKLLIFAFLITDLILIVTIAVGDHTMLILQPHGMIANEQRQTMIIATLLMLTIVIPVLTMTFFVGWKYRAGNTNTKYTPDWDHNLKLQLTWWGILCFVVLILSIFNWKTAHQLDPYKPLAVTTKPITIQVVALRWKWLFIYPEQGIATVNFVEFPEKTPINFKLTADAPMNGFWIPQLGGQMYAMTGMITPLHLIADKTGEFPGSTAELSGAGFAGMRFIAKSVSQSDFDSWVDSVKQSPQQLTLETYNKLAQPSEDTPPTFYASTDENLYTTILMKFMAPSSNKSHLQNEATKNEMPGMQM